MKITDNTSAVLREVNRRVSLGLEEVAPVLEATAKKLVTVVTGTTRDSISAEVIDGRLVVGTPLDHAAKLEMDKPFLRPALEASMTKIKRVFKI